MFPLATIKRMLQGQSSTLCTTDTPDTANVVSCRMSCGQGCKVRLCTINVHQFQVCALCTSTSDRFSSVTLDTSSSGATEGHHVRRMTTLPQVSEGVTSLLLLCFYALLLCGEVHVSLSECCAVDRTFPVQACECYRTLAAAFHSVVAKHMDTPLQVSQWVCDCAFHLECTCLCAAL